MAVKWKTEINKFPDMAAKLKRIDGKTVLVGLKGEQAYIASIHEYGCKIPVTPKMRAWLHRHGLHLKKSTEYIVIPERAFLRTGFHANVKKALERGERILPQILNGSVSENELFEAVGTILRDGIKDYAVNDVQKPSKHPFTLEMENGAENPLVFTGDMINSIEYEVEE